VVVTSGGTTLTLSGAFTYASPPTVSAISPNLGSTAGGTSITIQGAFFAPGATVRIGGSPATDITVPDANTITARTPAHAAGLVEVAVTSGGLTTALANAFTYLPPVPATSAVSTVSFGDSITFGVTSQIVSMGTINMVASTTTTGYPQRLQALLAARYTSQSITVTTSGVPGECISAVCPPNSQSGQTRLPSALAGQPNLVILLEGVNDTNAVVADATLLADVQRVATRLRSMVQTAKQGGRSVILSTLLPAAPDALLGEPRASLARIRALNTEIRNIAALEAVVLVDMFAAFGGDTVNAAWLSPDGLHPNDAGYQRMAQVFYDTIRTRFEAFSGS
jgi:lysophospholipase L1-like esterase